MTVRTSNIDTITILRERIDVSRADTGSAPGYRYIITDALTDTIVAEVPFEGVQFTRGLIRAGTFSGSIPVIEATDHLNLYDSTMPGKRSLYVLRGDTCVWGGMIWSRSYNAMDRTLNVSGSEFQSYMYHRAHWQTSIYPVETDKFDVVRDMINKMNYDFSGLDFANEIIAPDKLSLFSVLSITRVDDTVTLETLEPHELYVGQGFIARGVDASIDGPLIATNIISPTAVDVISAGTAIPTTALTGIRIQDIRAYSIGANFGSGGAIPPAGSGGVIDEFTGYLAGIVTIFTLTDHGLSVGDIIDVNVTTRGGGYMTGTWEIDFVPDTDMIQFYYDPINIVSSNIIVNSASATPPNGTVTYGPRVAVSSYGPYTFNSNIEITPESTDQYGYDEDQQEQVWRGYELKTFGDILEDYANAKNGFDYRIDCFYDPATDSFTKSFVFLSRELLPAPAEGQSALTRFGAEDMLFEFPGAIIDIQMDESAEQAATRMWVVGNDPYLSGDASQPYASVSDLTLFDDGWPILDQVETRQSDYAEEALREHAQEFLYEARPPIADIKVSVNGSVYPVVGSFYPGDWCGLVIHEDKFLLQRLAHPLEPRSDVLIRKINGFTVRVPDGSSYPEEVSLELIEDWKLDNAEQA